jgi:Tfp pilus assembly protein PilF
MLEKAYNYVKANELPQGLKAVELACANEATANDPRAWYLKGYIYQELYRLYPDSLAHYRQEALLATTQCRRLDQEGILRNDCATIDSFIYTSYFNDAIEHLNEAEYQKASAVFNLITADSTQQHYPEALFYSGYSSLMQGKTAQANILFSKSLQANYHDPLIYDQLSQDLLNRNLPVEAEGLLKQGRRLYPQDEKLQLSALNLYMATQQYADAERIAENYLADHPNDLEVMLVAGTIYEKRFQADTAQQETYFNKRKNIYLKALEIAPDNALANYNLGITLYNQAVSIINRSDVYTMDILDFDELLGRCTNYFKEALPYIRKANELSPGNINTLKALEGIYYNLNDREQFASVQKKLENLKK